MPMIQFNKTNRYVNMLRRELAAEATRAFLTKLSPTDNGMSRPPTPTYLLNILDSKNEPLSFTQLAKIFNTLALNGAPLPLLKQWLAVFAEPPSDEIEFIQQFVLLTKIQSMIKYAYWSFEQNTWAPITRFDLAIYRATFAEFENVF